MLKPIPFREDAAGYELLWGKLRSPAGTLVALEATGHYWKNLFAALVTRGFRLRHWRPVWGSFRV